jgi:hypothetical protein
VSQPTLEDAGALEAAYPGMVLPKFATPRDFRRRTVGTLDAQFAEVWLRCPLMPWQRYVADLGGELDPDTGDPAHSTVLVTLPRQAGKSHLDMAQVGQRCFTRPMFRSWYTAQTGADARDQFLKFADDVVAETPLDRVVRTLRGNGHESMKFPNGSTLRPHPPVEKALHGKQSDRNGIDEAWAFTETQGAQLLAAIGPTQLTRPGAQTWIWSAGGTANSTWLASLVARGRDGDPSICYVEYGIPDDMDPDDVDGVASYHPAYGHTVTVDSLRRLRDTLGDPAAFARAAGNRWTEVIGSAIDSGVWAVVCHPGVPEIQPGSRLAYGAARSPDGSMVAIAVAAELDGRIIAEVLQTLPTAYRAAEHVLRWANGSKIVLDPTGASASLSADLERAGARNVQRLTPRDAAAACSDLLDGLKVSAHLFRPHPDLEAARLVAGVRTVSGGGVAWTRTALGAPTAPLEAVTYAIRGLHRPPAETPFIRFTPA